MEFWLHAFVTLDVSVQLHACCILGEGALGAHQIGLRAGLDAVAQIVDSAPSRTGPMILQ